MIGRLFIILFIAKRTAMNPFCQHSSNDPSSYDDKNDKGSVGPKEG